MKHDVCLRMAAAVTAVLLLASCRLTQPVEDPAEDQTPETGESARTGTLLMDFTSGSNVEDVRPVELEQGIAMSDLCSTLEEITGIQFDFTVTMDQAGCTVTWQESSALIQGETPQDEQQDYVFYDDGLLRWFMLDTVWRNLTEEFGAAQVVYTGPDGAALQLEEPWRQCLVLCTVHRCRLANRRPAFRLKPQRHVHYTTKVLPGTRPAFSGRAIPGRDR